MSKKLQTETVINSATSKIIRLRVWLANEHGYELNHAHIAVPAADLNDCHFVDLEAVEEARQELFDDYVETLTTDVERVCERDEDAANESR